MAQHSFSSVDAYSEVRIDLLAGFNTVHELIHRKRTERPTKLISDEVNPYDVVETVGLWHCCRSARLGSAVGATFWASETLSNPVGNLWFAVAAAQHASKVRGGRVTRILVSELEVLLLLSSGFEARGRLLVVTVVTVRLEVVLFGTLLFSSSSPATSSVSVGVVGDCSGTHGNVG